MLAHEWRNLLFLLIVICIWKISILCVFFLCREDKNVLHKVFQAQSLLKVDIEVMKLMKFPKANPVKAETHAEIENAHDGSTVEEKEHLKAESSDSGVRFDAKPAETGKSIDPKESEKLNEHKLNDAEKSEKITDEKLEKDRRIENEKRIEEARRIENERIIEKENEDRRVAEFKDKIQLILKAIDSLLKGRTHL